MSIQQHIASPIATGVLSFVQSHGISFAGSALEAGFYHSLKCCDLEASRTIQATRKFSIDWIHESQMFFNITNYLLVAASTYQLSEHLSKSNSNLTFLPTLGLCGATIYIGLIAIFGNSNVPISGNSQDNQFYETKSKQQVIARFLHTTKLVSQISLLWFEKNRFLLAAGIAISAYSCLKNVRLKWMSLTREIPYNMEIRSYDHVYPLSSETVNVLWTLSIPEIKPERDQECAICLEYDTDVAFCEKHSLHKACLTGEVAVNTIWSNTHNLKSLEKSTSRHYRNGCYTGTSVSYLVSLDEDTLPTCPSCRKLPICPSYEGKVLVGSFSYTPRLNLPPDGRTYQSLFETVYSLYSTAQAGLNSLARYPELAGTVYKIQLLLFVFDLFGYVASSYYFTKKLREKYQNTNFFKFYGSVAAAAIVNLALSCLIMTCIHSFKSSSSMLNATLQGSGLCKGMEVSFSPPPIFFLAQMLYINRFFSTLALASVSNQRKTNLVSATTQLAALLGISQLNWISIQQLTSNCGLSKLLTTAYFRVSPACITDSDHLKSTLKSIDHKIRTLFDNCTWERYWRITTHDGIEIGRDLHYDVTLVDNPIKACACSLTAEMTNLNFKDLGSNVKAIVESTYDIALHSMTHLFISFLKLA